MADPAKSSVPYLSVVAASRNDDHGGDPLVRTQVFINCFARQCEKYRLPAELIIVDWNPVAGRTGLAGVLQLPAEAAYCQARVITVPAALHARFKHAERLPFFQMIAKNAGIRRARGRFILATNIDIIFSDELMRHIARQQLDPSRMLRVDRYDIHRDLPTSFSLEQALDYAWTHPIRANRRLGPKALVDHLYGADLFKRHCRPEPATLPKLDGIELVAVDADLWSVRPRRDMPVGDLHTNACGDFTLLSRAGWEAIHGYIEFAGYSFNIDTLGVAAAHYAGFQEEALLPPCVCFHIEHSLGSGWTPEGEQHLFARLRQNRIPNPEWDVVYPLMEAMRLGELPVQLNGPAWGLVDFDLPDEPLLPGRSIPGLLHPRSYEVPAGSSVNVLPAAYDLDLLILWHKHLSHRLNERIAAGESALAETIGYLRQVEKDSENRLEAIRFYQGKLMTAQEEHARNVEYLQLVEKDSADRLASIRYYEDKLKQAYADHDHNVAYIGRIHDEIAAHVKVSAEKDAIIARLSEQLRLASAGQSAGP